MQVLGVVFFFTYLTESLPYADGVLSGRFWGFLVENFEYGPTLLAAALAIGYTIFSVLLKRSHRVREGWRALEDVYFVAGMAFLASVAILSLDLEYVSMVWAIQGFVVFWLGIRHRRSASMVTGAVLQILAGLCFLAFGSQSLPYPDGTTPLVNPYFAALLLLAVTGLATGRLLDRVPEVGGHIRGIRWVALAWGAGWWLAAGLVEILNQLPGDAQLNASLAFVTVSLGGMVIVAPLLGWPRLGSVGVLFLPTVVLALSLSLGTQDHPFEQAGWAAWIVAMALFYQVLRLREDELPPVATAMHVGGYWVLAVLVGTEVHWQVERAAGGIWPIATALATVLAVVAGTLAARRRVGWPLEVHRRTYLMACTGPVLLVLSLWLLNLFLASPGDPAPLTYLPLLNPLELLAVLAALAVLAWKRMAESEVEGFIRDSDLRRAGPFLGLLGVVLLTVAVARTVHHWKGVPFDLPSMTFSTTLQASLAIVWALAGLTGMVVGVRLARRIVWVGGASLMALVVAKLFLFDLRNTGTVARVVSFLGVGVLLLVVGYFAPVPPSASARSKEAQALED